VVCVRLPEVPVTVTFTAPVVAELLAVKVRLLDPPAVGFGLKAAVTPLGRAELLRVTLPLKPFDGVMVMVVLALLPCVTGTFPGDADRLKFPCAAALTVRLTTVVWDKLLEVVPVTVTLTEPVVAVLEAVNVSVAAPLAGFGLKIAVTPLGNAEVEKFTLLLNPFDGVMVIVVLALLPCVTDTFAGDADSV
jgi:hypothetical protein